MSESMSFDDPRREVWLASDLYTLDEEEISEGYRDAFEGFPCSGNRGRAYWHGWQNGMVDSGKMEKTVAMGELARDVAQKRRFDELMAEHHATSRSGA
jgi:hypothetical protein